MIRPIHPGMEWRRARALEMLSEGPSPAFLAGHQPVNNPAQNRRPLRDSRLVRRYIETVGNVCERLLWTALKRVQRRHYFNCCVSDDGSDVVCIDGDGFRVVSGRHRLFLQLSDGRRHSFTLATTPVVGFSVQKPDDTWPRRGPCHGAIPW